MGVTFSLIRGCTLGFIGIVFLLLSWSPASGALTEINEILTSLNPESQIYASSLIAILRQHPDEPAPLSVKEHPENPENLYYFLRTYLRLGYDPALIPLLFGAEKLERGGRSLIHVNWNAYLEEVPIPGTTVSLSLLSNFVHIFASRPQLVNEQIFS